MVARSECLDATWYVDVDCLGCRVYPELDPGTWF